LISQGLSVIYGFVFIYDQICFGEYLAIGSMVGTNISHGFGVYSHVFWVYPRVQQFSQELHQISISNKYSTLHDSAVAQRIVCSQ